MLFIIVSHNKTFLWLFLYILAYYKLANPRACRHSINSPVTGSWIMSHVHVDGPVSVHIDRFILVYRILYPGGGGFSKLICMEFLLVPVFSLHATLYIVINVE
ncbi:hypothetical protein GDO86_002678 [Hymenochirus boettgeri]|uniref:Uncharacterized protein n=1 Tax=Hymenochirus boettgeri TaxID=247094 RepID=A0A8T2K3D1_9PIPI|nr:hypothetical protein GDO86_002678 [Hymenochirus boettgeri]